MGVAGDIRVRLGADATSLKAEMKNVEKSLKTVEIRAKLLGDSFDEQAATAEVLKRAINTLTKKGLDENDESLKSLVNEYKALTTQMKQAGNEAGDAGSKVSTLGERIKSSLSSSVVETSKKFAAGVAAIVASVGALGIAGVKMSADMEQTRMAFTTMLGSAREADTFLSGLAQFAAKTPFEMPGLINASKKLLAFGFNAQQIVPMMTAIGDAVSGLGGGTAEIERATTALGQMRAKGKVSAEEMMQLAEMGIPAWQMLADSIGTGIPEAMKLAEQGAISADTGINAVLQGMTAKFGGMMEKQSKTLAGIWSNLKDNATQSLTEIGNIISEKLDLSAKFKRLNDAFTAFTTTLKGSGLRAALDGLIPPGLQVAIVAVSGAIVAAMVPALISLATAAWAAMVPLLPFIVAGAALAATAFLIYKNWGTVTTWFKTTWVKVCLGVQVAWLKMQQIILNVIKRIMDGISPITKVLPKSMAAAFENARKNIAKSSDGIETRIRSLAKEARKSIADIEASSQRAAKADKDTKTKTKTKVTTVATTTATTVSANASNPIRDALDQLNKDMNLINSKAALASKGMFSGFDKAKEKAQSLETAITSLLDAGLKPTSSTVQKLVSQYQTWQNQIKATEKNTESLRQSLEKLTAHSAEAINQAALGTAESTYNLRISKFKDDIADVTKKIQDTIFAPIRNNRKGWSGKTDEEIIAYLETATPQVDPMAERWQLLKSVIQGDTDAITTLNEGLQRTKDALSADNNLVDDANAAIKKWNLRNEEALDPLEKMEKGLRAIGRDDIADKLHEMATEQKAYNDEVDRTKKLNDAMKGLGKKLKDSTLGNMPVLNGAVEGASLGSGVAGAAGIIISVAGAFLSLVTSSETFQTLMDNVNPILQAFSDAIGRLLEPILPLVAIISTVLSPLLDMLGSILASTILPIMPFLFNGLKTLGVWILRAAYIIGEFRNKIIDVITGLMRGLASVNFLGARPFAALADTAAALEKNKINLEELAKSIQEVQNLTWDEAMAKAKLASATNDATEAMKNLPSGIKIAALRYQVALPKYHTGGVPSQDGLAILRKNEAVLTPEQQQSLAGAGGNIIIQGDVYGYDDFRRKVNQARQEGKRSSGLGKRGLAGAMA